ncbi:MAG TPA: nitrilase-related carbon-nitrogen hydrolase [Candidatus Paceibacterota bacterium]|nr:nitrilase-related carbon-nitrogen hydrolase [Candidatus Paceibacterota bacterium]
MYGAIAAGIVSGLLLTLGAPPFSAPLLSFAAFAPLAYLVSVESSHKKLFYAGFVAGALEGGVVAYYIFRDFAWPNDAPLVLAFIHWSFVFWALGLGCALGLLCIAYQKLRGNSVLYNAAIFASLYCVLEESLQLATGHYYIPALAYTVAYSPLAMSISSLGGELLVSWCIAFISALIGEFAAAPAARKKYVALQALGIVAAAALVYIGNEYYLSPGTPTTPLTVATIQTGSRQDDFAHDYNGSLSFPALASKLNNIAASSTDLIIYPLAVVNEVLYTEAPPAHGYGTLAFLPRTTLESWMRSNAPASTTILTWDITYQNGEYRQNYDFWQSGSLIGTYSKRHPYAFMEYTPSFAHFGFGPTPAPISPGSGSGLTTLPSGIVASNLQCSEVHLSTLARTDAMSAQVFLDAGFEWVLPGDVGEEYSLEAAQYRAAENNIPAVRAVIEGPSAIIDARGKIIDETSFGEATVLKGTLAVPTQHRRTLYSLMGDYPLYGALIAVLAAAAYFRRRRR